MPYSMGAALTKQSCYSITFRLAKMLFERPEMHKYNIAPWAQMCLIIQLTLGTIILCGLSQ